MIYSLTNFKILIKRNTNGLHTMGRPALASLAVGDDDQSIYGFRRALGYDGLQKFTKEFNARRIMLGSNYRCRSEILSAASIFIGRNTERIEKVIVAAKGEGGIVMWELFDDKSSEANAVAEEAFLAQQEGVSLQLFHAPIMN
jgi:superfamily I DNA/RNA helicase